MKTYIYEGPVLYFGRVIDNKWKGETMAASPEKAKSNLIYRYKKEHGRTVAAKIELPGQIKEC